MKKSIIIIALLLSSSTLFAQSDSTKVADTVHNNSVPMAPKIYYHWFNEAQENALLQTVQMSNAPHATVQSPTQELIVYQLQHQPVFADTNKTKKSKTK